jgi:hypothetical protein
MDGDLKHSTFTGENPDNILGKKYQENSTL